METAADKLIDALGGTSAVARMTETPISTVHSWRKNGVPQSRLAHMKLAAQMSKPDVDFDRLAMGVAARASQPAAEAA